MLNLCSHIFSYFIYDSMYNVVQSKPVLYCHPGCYVAEAVYTRRINKESLTYSGKNTKSVNNWIFFKMYITFQCDTEPRSED